MRSTCIIEVCSKPLVIRSRNVKPLKIFVVRHGQTNYNLQNLCNNDPSIDVFLTEDGVKQAEGVAEELKDKQFEAIFISNLRRTKQTAEIINRHHKALIIEDLRIGDRKTGFESKPAEVFYDAVKAAPDGLNAKFNGGESFSEEKARVFAFIDELANGGYTSVLIVTHAEIMKLIFGYFYGLKDEDMWEMNDFKNTEVITLTAGA